VQALQGGAVKLAQELQPPLVPEIAIGDTLEPRCRNSSWWQGRLEGSVRIGRGDVRMPLAGLVVQAEWY
jgi:hypothetical protein